MRAEPNTLARGPAHDGNATAAGPQQVQRTDAECGRQLEQRGDGRIAPAAFQVADILLRQSVF